MGKRGLCEDCWREVPEEPMSFYECGKAYGRKYAEKWPRTRWNWASALPGGPSGPRRTGSEKAGAQPRGPGPWL